MKLMLYKIKQWNDRTCPRSPQQVAEAAYRSWSYTGRHRYHESTPVQEPDVWRTLKLGWQAYIQPIPVTEVFT